MRVDRARDQLLARAGFTLDQHGRRRASHPRDQLVHLEHHRALAHDVLQVRLALRRLGLLLLDQPLAFQGAPDGQAQLLDVERLRYVVVRAPLDRLHRAGDVAERGDQDDRRRRRLARERREHVEPARALHAHVRDDQIVAALLRPLHRARAVIDRLDLVPFAAQDLAQQIARHAIVLRDQHLRRPRHARPPAARGRDSATGGPWRGSRTKNVEPLPAALSTEIVPPSAAVSCRQMARPRPVPLPRPLVV